MICRPSAVDEQREVEIWEGERLLHGWRSGFTLLAILSKGVGLERAHGLGIISWERFDLVI
jgi:hypothetical protein